MKRTPLYEKHLEYKGKLIDFGGWELPVEYVGIIPEHEAVRNSAGLFDVSHMGEVTVTGEDAEKYIQKMVTNDISNMDVMQIYYSPMCYPNGGVVDDLLIYKYNREKYLLVINAANTEKDVEWLQSNVSGNLKVKNVSSEYAQLALQGPKAQKILQKLTDKNLDDIKFFHFCDEVPIGEMKVFVSRNGYTGEDGFEVLVAPQEAEKLWDRIIEAGKEDGLLPAGLGARDTLRFEVCLPLYGHEINDSITPLEAGLGFFVKLDKDDFIGKEELMNQKSSGLKRKLCGIEMIDRGIPRAGFEVFSEGRKIGYITSGSYSPTLKKNIGLALMDIEFSEEGREVEVLIRNKLLKTKIIKKPFYAKKYKNKR
ncbi:MAG: glycine cleavage system aminomethyltransferase GcvT [Peptostreptococcaceae bacterium]|nr:glycine cleavage system aminomethyltransferase GcvT [Peptostreptococcaceae bacterium]